MSASVTIGIIGDYDGGFRAHVATNDALRHAAEDRSLPLCVRWLPTEDLAGGADGEAVLAHCDGLGAAPGSPYRSMEGALRASALPASGAGPSWGREGASSILC
jgi:CTP synthase (UTP-ammonia lyase)